MYNKWLRKLYLSIATFLLFISSISAQEVATSDSLEFNVNLKISGSRMTGVFNRSSLAFVADKH